MPSVTLAAPAVLLVGGASIVYMTATAAVAQVDTRRDMQGRVLALQTALMGGTALVGGPLVGQRTRTTSTPSALNEQALRRRFRMSRRS